MVAYPDYLMNQALPFSWRGWMKTHEAGASMEAQALSFFGIQPAPQSITNPAREQAWDERQRKLAERARMRDPGRLSFGASGSPP